MNIKKPIIISKSNSLDDLFGIDQEVFKKIVDNNDSCIHIKSIEAIDYINKNYYGGRGEKAVVKLLYSEDNREREVLLFIKQHSQLNPNEALHYKYLSEFNAPIPSLYAYYSKTNEHDIIITEVIRPFYVDDDPAFMLNKHIFKPFIEATALFNSTKIDDEYKKIITKDYDLLNDKLRNFHGKIKSMFQSIEADSIYQSLRNKVDKRMEAKIIDILESICRRIEKMEKGLYHWDHKPRNMGWSERQQKHVIFDLEDTLWGPRFYNIGMWIGGDDEVEEKYASREDLAEIYLSIYNEGKKEKVSVDCLLYEGYPLWIAYKIETLLYYYYESGAKPYRLREKDPVEYKKEMEDRLIQLINLLCDLNRY